MLQIIFYYCFDLLELRLSVNESVSVSDTATDFIVSLIQEDPNLMIDVPFQVTVTAIDGTTKNGTFACVRSYQ